ncbi:Indole-3-acetic acid-induced protein ARG2 [Spatholobus suberectus]|nr:Indole-3-acetic acid-induced protein ARG2 [Spatholobus suberectus]
MARSFTNTKIFSSLVIDGFSNALTRRGYAVASQSATRGGVASISNKMAPKSGEDKVVSTYKVSWVPDPVTGYYKPENINEIDVAELRATLLGKKFNN